MLTANGKEEEGGNYRDMVLCEMGKRQRYKKFEDKLQTFPLQPTVNLEFYRLGAMWTYAALFGLCSVCVCVYRFIYLRFLSVVQDTSATQAASLRGATLPALPLSSLTTAPPVTV